MKIIQHFLAKKLSGRGRLVSLAGFPCRTVAFSSWLVTFERTGVVSQGRKFFHEVLKVRMNRNVCIQSSHLACTRALSRRACQAVTMRIVEQYIREGAPDQVNRSEAQTRKA